MVRPSSASWGSSPLSRGILFPRRSLTRHTGIIPALAGNTAEHRCTSVVCRDHPRSRGEYKARSNYADRATGSSPLSRGIPPYGGHRRFPRRIIPALAGNTDITANRNNRVQDHPRSRGEYHAGPGRQGPLEGSSPLSRGIQGIWTRGGCGFGIIPALAGNTKSAPSRMSFQRDHPRSRGEYDPDVVPKTTIMGSSPLSRGIPRPVSRLWRSARIIPALAGNTIGVEALRDLEPDHPRSRGEYGTLSTSPGSRPGSSPLSRGIPDHW